MCQYCTKDKLFEFQTVHRQIKRFIFNLRGCCCVTALVEAIGIARPLVVEDNDAKTGWCTFDVPYCWTIGVGTDVVTVVSA